ncbi:hypothetical protein ACJMK2_032917 [Sinanodonta woodiana]|uniref:Ceramide phosphoethanolamine synthase n=1 Tax=Sinanodonta woodiana TaxID=1069815 RepID=A0ABD3X373_SINWO
MFQLISQSIRNERSLLLIFGLSLLVFFVVMDMVLYVTLQSTKLVDQPRTDDIIFSPFYPLSIKLLMMDPVNHYIITPTTEYFNALTKFSEVFYFITPNMVSITHLIIGCISGKLVSSENLKTRRIGCILYEVRFWFDSFDGTLYRARSGKKEYVSNKSNVGYYVDSVCDTLSGFALSFGIMFYLFKCPPTKSTPSLTWPNDAEKGTSGEVHIERTNGKYSKRFIFFRTFCYGLLIGISSLGWDRNQDNYSAVFQKKLDDPKMEALQTSALHSTTTWLIIWFWRIFQGQAFLHVLVVVIFIDVVWECFKIVQYAGLLLLIMLLIFSEVHLQQVRNMLNIPARR